MLSCLLDMHTLSLNLEISSERHVKSYQPSLLGEKKVMKPLRYISLMKGYLLS